jgi:hypothetical protein
MESLFKWTAYTTGDGESMTLEIVDLLKNHTELVLFVLLNH